MGLGTKLLKMPHPLLHTAPYLALHEIWVEQVSRCSSLVLSLIPRFHQPGNEATLYPDFFSWGMEEKRIGLRLNIQY